MSKLKKLPQLDENTFMNIDNIVAESPVAIEASIKSLAQSWDASGLWNYTAKLAGVSSQNIERALLVDRYNNLIDYWNIYAEMTTLERLSYPCNAKGWRKFISEKYPNNE